jgi:hypothetical protein
VVDVPIHLDPERPVDLTTTEMLIAAGAALVVLLLIAAVVVLVRRRRRRNELKERVGNTEYERTVDRVGSKRRAEEQLEERRARRDSFDVRELTSAERTSFRGRFEAVEASFVDGPEAAVRAADVLLDAVAEKRGYPAAAADQRLDDLSVDHPGAVDRYRSSRPTSNREGGMITTEQHRQALLGSRTLFEALVGREETEAPDAPRSFRDIIPDDDGHDRSDNGHRRPEVTRH